MAILTRPKIHAQQRLDLEDWNTLLSSFRTDSKFWTKSILSGKNQVISGFSVSGIGSGVATVNLAGGTILVPQNSADFSYFMSPSAATTEDIPATSFVSATRNYIEAELCYSDGTPLNRAFFNPTANSGAGEEFSQEVNTVTDIKVQFHVAAGGFSGSVDRVPLAIVDTDGSGQIVAIYDRRDLFGRLATGNDPASEYSWSSQQEPSYSLVLSGVTGTFTVGETITIDGSESAKVLVGGTSPISVNELTGIGFSVATPVVGLTSGATATLDSIEESFSGADKDLNSVDLILKALMTEVKRLKGTDFWYEKPERSINVMVSFVDSIIVQTAINAKYFWDGTNLSITDVAGVPADADVMGKVRQMGHDRNLDLTRQDVASAVIPVGERQVLFIKIPKTGDRVFSGVGTSDTNYQVVDAADFVQTDETYYLAYRENGLLYVRGYGELESGESTPLSDPDKETLLAAIASVNPLFNSQDRSLQIIEGGLLSVSTNGQTLTLSATANVQVPGLSNSRNFIPAQSITLPNTNSVAYVEILRTAGAATAMTVNVSDMDALTPTSNTVVIARRVSTGIMVGTGETLIPASGVARGFSGLSSQTIIPHVYEATTTRTLLDDDYFINLLAGGTITVPVPAATILGRQFMVNTGNTTDYLVISDGTNPDISRKPSTDDSIMVVTCVQTTGVPAYKWLVSEINKTQDLEPRCLVVDNSEFELDIAGWIFADGAAALGVGSVSHNTTTPLSGSGDLKVITTALRNLGLPNPMTLLDMDSLKSPNFVLNNEVENDDYLDVTFDLVYDTIVLPGSPSDLMKISLYDSTDALVQTTELFDQEAIPTASEPQQDRIFSMKATFDLSTTVATTFYLKIFTYTSDGLGEKGGWTQSVYRVDNFKLKTRSRYLRGIGAKYVATFNRSIELAIVSGSPDKVVTGWNSSPDTLNFNDSITYDGFGSFIVNRDINVVASCNIMFKAETAGASTNIFIAIIKHYNAGGTLVRASQALVPALITGAAYKNIAVTSKIFNLKKGEYFKIEVFQNTGSTKNIYGGTNYSYFTIQEV